MHAKAVVATLGVFIGCCSNVVFLEMLVKLDPGSGNLITFLQFLFIAIEGLIFTSKFGLVKPKIGLKDYSLLVVMFFVSSVCNNYAFDFNIPMPLHMVFRAGSLIANMFMGIVILKKHYEPSKYVSVFLITAGVFICTILSGNEVKGHETSNQINAVNKFSVFFWWTVGILLLTVALLISACMGIYQEVLYKKFGKHPREALFYTHLMPLPGFALLYTNIKEHLLIAMQSEPIVVSESFIGIKIAMPMMIFYLLANVVTQYICISSVYVLTTECSSLSVTLIVTLRKFVSLIFSILYFKNSFTTLHWASALLVFIGTLIFTQVLPNISMRISNRKKDD